MNGRAYDPLIGQFLSPDDQIQNPSFTQNYNRYAYCLNNPLVYSDPSGDNYLQYMNSHFNQFDYRGGYYSEGTWYQPQLSGGGYAPATNPSYDPSPSFEENMKSKGYTYYTNEYGIGAWIPASEQTEVTYLYFWGTHDNPYQTLVGYETSDGTKVRFSDNSQSGGDGLKTTLNNINDGFNAIGTVRGAAETFTNANAPARIVYTAFNGTSATVSSAKVASTFKAVGTTAYGASIAVDITLSATGNQSWTKTGINTGVGYACLRIGGWPGFLIGVGYTVIDKTVGWDRVLTPTPNHPGTFIDENGNMGIR